MKGFLSHSILLAILLALTPLAAAPPAAGSPVRPGGAEAIPPASIPHPLYAYGPLKKQHHRIDRRIRRILYPTIALPALVARGGVLTVLVRDFQQMCHHWSAALTSQLLHPRQRGRVIGKGRRQHHRLSYENCEKAAGTTEALKLTFRVPLDVPRDTFHLEVKPQGRRTTGQPSAVRVVARQARDFDFVIFADHQLRDPTALYAKGDLNTRAYPGAGKKDRIRAIAEQGFREAAFLDPEFALHLGDLVFGVDYHQEMAQAWELMAGKRFAMFAIPGNHDGYALYDLKFTGTVMDILKGGITCKNHLDGTITPARAFKFLACMFGDLTPYLFSHPLADGLNYWRRMLGPTHYSFDYGGIRFIGANSYDGTPERRHAYVFSIGFLKVNIEVPSVDNYGGYLTEGQLAWITRQMEGAVKAGKQVVLLLHHDFRGNLEEKPRYHANLGFPTNPFGIGSFTEWNYDSPKWDSDKSDQRSGEQAGSHNGIRLCRLVARYADHTFIGHRHGDTQRHYKRGEEICPGVKALKPLSIIRTTTASSSPHGSKNYWGYRLVKVRGGRIKEAGYLPRFGLRSLPAGNFWVSPSGPHEQTVVNALPTPVSGVVRFDLPPAREGYRIKDEDGNTYLPREVALTEGGHFSYVPLTIEAGRNPQNTRTGSARRIRLKATLAAGNHLPVPVITAPSEVEIDSTVELSAAKSHDPDRDRLIQYFWKKKGLLIARGPRASLRFSTVGSHTIELTVYDQNGARATAAHRLDSILPGAELPPWPTFNLLPLIKPE